MTAAYRSCPVCGAGHETATPFLEKNISTEKLSSFSFASRKVPEFMCHQLVRCNTCDLVYANQPPSEEYLSLAYHAANYDSSEEANDAAAAYMQAMQSALQNMASKVSALEIGTGTGVLLQHLSSAGFKTLVGVEPSTAAIAAAPADRQPWIRHAMFHEADFKPASFDLICCFMTMEHVRDPKIIANAAFRLLRPGGAFVTVTHDYHSFVNRLLGKRSPIIDIEHMQLFSKNSIKQLFKVAGFEQVEVKAFANTYALSYWLRISPAPKFVKAAASWLFDFFGWHKTKLSVNVGNAMTVGMKHAKLP